MERAFKIGRAGAADVGVSDRPEPGITPDVPAIEADDGISPKEVGGTAVPASVNAPGFITVWDCCGLW